MKNYDGSNSLMYAVKHNYEGMVSFLIDKGADINMKNKYGTTALMYAAHINRKSMVSFLIDKGADINMKDNVSIFALRLFELYLFLFKNDF